MSSYTSPVVIVRKKCGAIQLCVNYREPNRRTKYNSRQNPLPRIQEILDNFGDIGWFSMLDLRKTNHRGKIHTDIQIVYCFHYSVELYEWARIPFSLMNVPSAFQRAMGSYLHGLRVHNVWDCSALFEKCPEVFCHVRKAALFRTGTIFAGG